MPETINAVDAWLGSLPGHVYANVRQPPISTLNLAHMIPLSAVWAGPERDEHFAVAPVAVWQDRGLDPVPVFLHVGDVGHTLVVGPTGAGKSCCSALMALAVPALRKAPRFSPSTSAARSARPPSPWAATGTISAAVSPRASTTSVSLQPLARHPRRAGARLGGGLDRRDPDPRGRPHHARGEGAPLVGADLAGVRAGRGTHDHRSYASCCSRTT